MTVYRRRQIDIAVPLRGMMALAVLALVSSVFAAEPPAPLPKAEPIRITPIAPAAVPVSGAAAMKVSQQPSPQAAPQPAAQQPQLILTRRSARHCVSGWRAQVIW